MVSSINSHDGNILDSEVKKAETGNGKVLDALIKSYFIKGASSLPIEEKRKFILKRFKWINSNFEKSEFGLNKKKKDELAALAKKENIKVKKIDGKPGQINKPDIIYSLLNHYGTLSPKSTPKSSPKKVHRKESDKPSRKSPEENKKKSKNEITDEELIDVINKYFAEEFTKQYKIDKDYEFVFSLKNLRIYLEENNIYYDKTKIKSLTEELNVILTKDQLTKYIIKLFDKYENINYVEYKSDFEQNGIKYDNNQVKQIVEYLQSNAVDKEVAEEKVIDRVIQEVTAVEINEPHIIEKEVEKLEEKAEKLEEKAEKLQEKAEKLEEDVEHLEIKNPEKAEEIKQQIEELREEAENKKDEAEQNKIEADQLKEKVEQVEAEIDVEAEIEAEVKDKEGDEFKENIDDIHVDNEFEENVPDKEGDEFEENISIDMESVETVLKEIQETSVADIIKQKKHITKAIISCLGLAVQ